MYPGLSSTGAGRASIEEGLWPENEEKSNQLVVIGRGLDEKEFRGMFEGCVIEDGEEGTDDDYFDEGEDYNYDNGLEPGEIVRGANGEIVGEGAAYVEEEGEGEGDETNRADDGGTLSRRFLCLSTRSWWLVSLAGIAV